MLKSDEIPDAEEIAEVMRLRWGIDPSHYLSLDISQTDENLPKISLSLNTGRDLFIISIIYLRGRLDDEWFALLDAVDAMLGALLENDYQHRELPQGPDVTYEDAVFSVDIQRHVPHLTQMADDFLNKHDKGAQ